MVIEEDRSGWHTLTFKRSWGASNSSGRKLYDITLASETDAQSESFGHQRKSKQKKIFLIGPMNGC